MCAFHFIEFNPIGDYLELLYILKVNLKGFPTCFLSFAKSSWDDNVYL